MRKIKDIFASFFKSIQSSHKKRERSPEVEILQHSGKGYLPPEPIRPRISTPIDLAQLDIKLHELTQRPVWDWECFRSILICLATMGEGYYIPATRRPNCIFLNGLQNTFAELREISVQRQGRETSRVVLVDKERSCLVISGKTQIGTIQNVKINMSSAPGRETVQLPVLTIHVHPNQGGAKGLSDRDYISFLSDHRQIIMMVCFQEGILFAMKTSATSKSIASDTAQRLISITRDDILKIWSKLNPLNSILAFNKAVCTEFGLTLYRATSSNENLARRIEVTQP